MVRDDRLEQRRTHFHRLLHHVVEARVLKRREQKMQIAGQRLSTQLRPDYQRRRPLAAAGKARAPFAVSTVEQQHPIALRKPEHVPEIVSLVTIEQNLVARGQWSADKKTGGPEVTARHRETVAKASAWHRLRALTGLRETFGRSPPLPPSRRIRVAIRHPGNLRLL